jgi:hypothetical protein
MESIPMVTARGNSKVADITSRRTIVLGEGGRNKT